MRKNKTREFAFMPGETIVLKGCSVRHFKKNPALLIVSIIMIIGGLASGYWFLPIFAVAGLGLILLGPGIYLVVRKKKEIEDEIMSITGERIIGKASKSPFELSDSFVSIPLPLIQSVSAKDDQIGIATLVGIYLFKGMDNADEVFHYLAERCQDNIKK